MLDPSIKSIIEKYINKNINRRSFLITAGVFTGSITLGSLLSYFYLHPKTKRPYTKEQDKIVYSVHNHLFPQQENSPGATDVNSLEYLHFVLSDHEIDEDNKNVLIKGVDRLEEECITKFGKSFIDLTSDYKDDIFNKIENSNWGYRFLSLNLIYIFEALLGDPIYGGNPDAIGWKWLEHTPGIPRPTKQTMYGEI